LEDRKVRRLDKGFAHFESWTAKVAEQEAEIARKQDKMIEREAYWLARGVTARRARNEGRLKRLKDLRAEKSERMRQERGSMSVAVDSGGASGKRVVEAKKLNKAYGGRVLLKDFSTRILRGDRVAVVGPNGAGKTTLVKMLLGEVAPDSGSVKLGSNLQTAYLDQARAALKPGLTLWETLAPLGGDQVLVRGQPRHVAAYAKDFLFRDNQLRQPVESLSGGERNRLLLAVALARPANLLVLDEPTNDLDMDTLDLLEELLADYDGTLILVSHDRDFVDRLATSTIALDGTGRAVETPGGWQDFVRQNPGFFMQAGAQSRPLHPPSGGPPPPLRGGGTKTASSSTVKRSGTGEGDHAKHGGGGVTTRKSAKLTYKDARRLEELDALMPRLHAQIAALEATLSDATLYARDPQAFGKAMSEITAARTTLAAAEEEWLVLEEKKEALG
ncbi:MAG: ATP-binding cassette domain-containing protein, partial [Caulobacteraceae bacterium]